MPNQLLDLKVGEVSLVPKGANRKHFLIVKQEEPMADNELLQAILDAELQDEERINEVLKAQGLSEKATNAVKGALRILNAFKDELPKDILNTLASLAGYGYAPAPTEKARGKKEEDEEYGEFEYGEKGKKKARGKKEEEEEETEKAGKKYPAPVKKADGTFDLSAVPDELRPTLEVIFKEHEQAVRKAQELEAVLKAEQDRRKTLEFVERAKQYTHLPINPDEFGPVLKQISESAPEAFQKLEQVLKAADENLRVAGSLKPVGRDSTGTGGNTAWDQICALASQLVEKSEHKLSFEAAVDKVLQSRPDLYRRYLDEQRRYGTV
jgi:hypothetical protein